MQNKVVTSACCLIPPEDLWRPIQDIRKKHDKAYERWPPHINLLYPFVPEREFAAAAEQAHVAAGRVPPFRVTLSRFSIFEHGKSCTVFLEPIVEPENALLHIYDALEAAFPFCSDLRDRGNGHFHGHLTVGQFKDAKTAKVMISTWTQTWKPIVWTVDAACFIARRGDTPFRVKQTIRLRDPARVELDHVKSAPEASEHVNGGLQPLEDAVRVDEGPYSPEMQLFDSVTQAESDFPEVRAPMEPRSAVQSISVSRNPRIGWPDGEIGVALHRIDQWLTSMAAQQRDKIPKTRSKLMAAIKNFCIVRQKPLTGSQICHKFVEEGIISFQGDVVKYLQKDSDAKPLPKIEDNPYGWRVTAEEKVLSRCRVWIRNPANAPKSRDTLERSIDQLAELKTHLDEVNVLTFLSDLDICAILDDREETVKYNL